MTDRDHPVESSLSTTSDRTAPHDRTRRALLIGVEQDIERRLRGVTERSIAARRDVQALQPLLQVSFTTVRPLIGLDRQQFEEEVYASAVASSPNDLLLIYYSGQGFVDEDGKLYLAAANTRSNSLGELNKTTAIAFTSIHELLKNCSASQVIILDCSLTAFNSRRFDLAAQLGAPNRVILCATRTTNYTTAHKQGELSLYTGFLQEAIATGCGLAPDTAVTTHHVHRYIQKRMQQAAPAIEPQIIPPHPEFELAIAVAPPLDEVLIYRSEVEARAQTGEISDFDRLILNWRRNQLGLSPDTASQIESIVLKPHQTYAQNCQRYRDTLSAIAQSQYPLRPATQMALAQFQQQLGLSATQADAIAKETLADHEQRYQQNLQQYEQYLTQQIESGAWLDRDQRNEFRYLEQQLHLLPRDLAAIWQRHAPADLPSSPQLQQYQQFFDQFPLDRPLPPQTLQELAALQQKLQLPDQEAALAEEAAVRQKRDRYDAQLQRYQEELLLADDSAGSRAKLQQMQRGLAEADVTIANSIASLLNPKPPAVVDAPTHPASPEPSEQLLEAGAVAIESVPLETTPTQVPTEIQPAMLAVESPKLERSSLPPDDDRTLPPRPRELQPGQTLPPRRGRPSIGERLRDRSLPLQLLKAVLFAIVAVVVGRFVIAQILRILPYPIDNIIGITLFGSTLR